MADKTAIRTERAPAPFQGAPYSQAIRVGDLVFVSGQLALKPDHAEIVGETIAGSGLDKLVKTTVYLVDLGDFAGMNEVYARHVGAVPPARATVEISALPSGARVEIEAIGHV
jgi:2-iminobutanoate/2-iminopropanoate deaminase